MFEDAKKALAEFDAWNRPDAAEAVAEALRTVLTDIQTVQADVWAEGHAATDDHGPGNCMCPNPYSEGRES